MWQGICYLISSEPSPDAVGLEKAMIPPLNPVNVNFRAESKTPARRGTPAGHRSEPASSDSRPPASTEPPPGLAKKPSTHAALQALARTPAAVGTLLALGLSDGSLEVVDPKSVEPTPATLTDTEQAPEPQPPVVPSSPTPPGHNRGHNRDSLDYTVGEDADIPSTQMITVAWPHRGA